MNKKGNFQVVFSSIVLLILLLLVWTSGMPKKDLKYDKKYENKVNNITKINNTQDVVYADKIPVITFHRVATHDIKEKYFKDNEWVNDMDIFDEEMQYLYDNGYETLSSEEFYCWYQGKCDFSEKTVYITIDDGDAELYYNVLPILKKYNFKATSFLIGEHIKEVTDPFDGIKKNYIGMDLIDEIKLTYPNLEFQSHTYGLHRMTKDKVPYAKAKSKEEIREDFNKNASFEFEFLAYPYGIYDDKLRSATKEAGYKLAFRFYPAKKATRKDKPYDINRIKINGFMTLEDMIKKLDMN